MRIVIAALTITAGLAPQFPRDPGPKMTAGLVVTGPRLERELQIADPAAIAANIYGGNFMTTVADAPDPYWPRYRVVFYTFRGGPVSVPAYAVTYVWNPLSEEGFVYLPGRGDADYRLNIGTVIRDGEDSPGLQPARDGYWHHAAPEWSAALNARLPRP